MRAGLKDIAFATNSPEAFTAKILQTLVRENLLLSIKGPNGGFEIARHIFDNVGDLAQKIVSHLVNRELGVKCHGQLQKLKY